MYSLPMRKKDHAMNTAKTKMPVTARRNRVKTLAFRGKTRREIQDELGLPYQTVSLDLKLMGIIPASTQKSKENA